MNQSYLELEALQGANSKSISVEHLMAAYQLLGKSKSELKSDCWKKVSNFARKVACRAAGIDQNLAADDLYALTPSQRIEVHHALKNLTKELEQIIKATQIEPCETKKTYELKIPHSVNGIAALNLSRFDSQ